jgi:DNA repair exonuclease SbcCD nuclease subunit
MASEHIRVLLVADTHLGLDLPVRPRVQRRRRGHDFLANFRQALQPARRDEVDLVVHGGDLYDRSRVPPALVDTAMAPLLEVAEHGVPVYLVPGNHERARIPQTLLTLHPRVHIFHTAQTFTLPVRGAVVALAGFPFTRRVRDEFARLVEATGHRAVEADVRLLCIHQTVEGAQVGPKDYTFRRGVDVIRGRDIPGGFAAVLAGHIHRAQMLTADLRDRPLATPVIIPGSVERSSFAERDEDKAYAVLALAASGDEGGRLVDVSFEPLRARPMLRLVLNPKGRDAEALRTYVRGRLQALDPDAVVRIQLRGTGVEEARAVLTAATLRELAPDSMNVTLERMK